MAYERRSCQRIERNEINKMRYERWQIRILIKLDRANKLSSLGIVNELHGELRRQNSNTKLALTIFRVSQKDGASWKQRGWTEFRLATKLGTTNRITVGPTNAARYRTEFLDLSLTRDYGIWRWWDDKLSRRLNYSVARLLIRRFFSDDTRSLRLPRFRLSRWCETMQGQPRSLMGDSVLKNYLFHTFDTAWHFEPLEKH